jgi:branched-chain amino acid transport system permease protein
MFFSAVLSGILLGGIYALVAAGLNLIFGVMKIINFAHGQILMLGMYLTWVLVSVLGLDLYVSLPVVFLATLALGAAIQRGLIEPVLKSERSSQLLITFGLGMVLQNGVVMVFGQNYHSLAVSYASNIVEVQGLRASQATLIAIVGSLVTLVALYRFLGHTRLGTSIRAVSQQPDSAALVGIDVQRVHVITFALGTGLVGIAATLMTPIYYVQPEVGTQFGVMAFMVVVLGGLGNAFGAALAGLIIGLVQNLFATFISVEMARAFTFLVFILILFVRPHGLFGRTARV